MHGNSTMELPLPEGYNCRCDDPYPSGYLITHPAEGHYQHCVTCGGRLWDEDGDDKQSFEDDSIQEGYNRGRAKILEQHKGGKRYWVGKYSFEKHDMIVGVSNLVRKDKGNEVEMLVIVTPFDQPDV